MSLEYLDYHLELYGIELQVTLMNSPIPNIWQEVIANKPLYTEETKKRRLEIARNCVWYASATWKRFRKTKQRTSFGELDEKEQVWFLMVAEAGLNHCKEFKFNSSAPFIINGIVYPVFLFKKKDGDIL